MTKNKTTLSLYQGGFPRVCRGVWPYCSSKTVFFIKPSADFCFTNAERRFLNVHFKVQSLQTLIFHFVQVAAASVF